MDIERNVQVYQASLFVRETISVFPIGGSHQAFVTMVQTFLLVDHLATRGDDQKIDLVLFGVGGVSTPDLE
jgi:hypothetical protein